MKKTISYIKNNKFFFLGLLILLGVVLINIFPKGYIISSTDTSQIINAKDFFSNLFFNFPNTFWYYGLIYILDSLNIPPTTQLSFTLGIFIFGSYLSFYTFTKLFFKKSNFLQSTFSLIYALNIFTLFTFTMHGLGYTSFYYLYIFIPLLIGFFIKFLTTEKFLFLALFCLTLFLTSPGFGNPAFFLSLIIILFFLLITLFITKKIKLSKRLLLNLILILIISFCISSFWLLDIFPKMKTGVENLNTTNETNLLSSLIGSGNQISDTLGLNNSSHDFFPFKFQYLKISFLKNIFIFLTYLPIILIVLGLILFKKDPNRKLLFSSLIILPLLIMGVAKIIPPFETLNYFVFVKVWGMNTLRASDKIFIFLPFFIILPLFILFYELKKTKYYKVGIVLLLLILITPLPFYLGKLQQTVGSRLSTGKDYKTSSLTFLVKIPQEYYLVKGLTDQKTKSFIATLPNNMGWSGTGSTSLPKWKLNGIDVTQNISGKRYIEPNPPIFDDWIFAKDFNEIASKDEVWIIKLLGMMNSQYILYHKDAPGSSVKKTLFKMRNLENRGLIKNLEENDYFILYEISSKYYNSYLTFQAERFDIQGSIISIERNFEKIKASTSKANFREVNPKKFIVDLNEENPSMNSIISPRADSGQGNLILAETFNPLWKAYYKLDSGKEIEIKDHFKARGYANGWKLNAPEDTKQIIVEYYPIRLMWRGIWISGVTVLFLIGYLIYYCIRNKRLK